MYLYVLMYVHVPCVWNFMVMDVYRYVAEMDYGILMNLYNNFILQDL